MVRPERAAGLVFVLALHAAALWGLWQHRLLPAPRDALTLFVNFITPPKKHEEPRRPPPPKPQPVVKPQPRQLVAETPVVAPTEYVAPPPPPSPAPVAVVPPAPPAPSAPPAPPKPAEPVVLSGELAVACPERMPPRYPPHSRRMGEEGTVVLRVELDESGHVATARVSNSSGHVRLDDAALAVIKTWRCTPATHHGRPVRAVALQPFKFVLE